MKNVFYGVLVLLTSLAVSAASQWPGQRSFGLGSQMTCAILEDQSITCWGGYRSGNFSPYKIENNAKTAVRKAVSIVSGTNHSCVLFDDHTVGCFGANESGQVNQLASPNKAEIQMVDLSYKRDNSPQPVLSLAAAANRSCAVLADGNVECWGVKEKNVPTQAETLRLRQERVKQIEMYKTLIVAQQATIEIEKRKLAEENKKNAESDAKLLKEYREKQVRDAEYELKEFNERITAIHERLHKEEERIESYKKTGYTYYKDDLKRARSDAKKDEAKVNKARHLYKSEAAKREKEFITRQDYYRRRGLERAEQLLGNYNTTLTTMIAENNRINTEQENFARNLIVDLGKKQDKQPYRATMVALGTEHACALLEDHSVTCWGKNTNGELGTGNLEPEIAAIRVDLGKHADGAAYTAKSIAARGSHSCAILDDDSAKCWGSNNYGELGDINASRARTQPVPTLISLGADAQGRAFKIAQIVPSDSFICALSTNGGVKCWGYNREGELGLGDTEFRSLTQIAQLGDKGFVDLDFEADALSCAENHCCATYKVNHLLKCWGRNYSGELGTGDKIAHGAAPETMGEKLPFSNLGFLHSVFKP